MAKRQKFGSSFSQEFGSFDVTEETTLSSNKDVVDNFDPSQLGTLLKVLRKKLSNADILSGQ
jgi:hypothetical protein